jgi:hypothetical protein
MPIMIPTNRCRRLLDELGCWLAGAGLLFGLLIGLILGLLAGCAAAVEDDPPAEQQIVAGSLVEVTGLEHERIEVNPTEIVALRAPRRVHRVLPAKANCAIMTTDGKFLSIIESCAEVRRKLERLERPR